MVVMLMTSERWEECYVSPVGRDKQRNATRQVSNNHIEFIIQKLLFIFFFFSVAQLYTKLDKRE